MLQKSHLIDMFSSHLTAFQHLEMRSSEQACPSSLSLLLKALVGETPVRPEEMVKYWSPSQSLRLWNHKLKSATLSGKVVKGEFVMIFKSSLKHNPFIYPTKQPISLESPRMPVIFFPFPDIWMSAVLNGGVHFLSALHHNHLKSQGGKKITQTSSTVEQRMNQRPQAWNNDSGATRRRDQK